MPVDSSDLLSGRTDSSKVLLACGMAPTRRVAALQPLCTVTPWKLPYLSMDSFSPLERTHNTESCVHLFSFKALEKFKVNFTYPDSSCGCPRKLDRGLYPKVSSAPLF